MKEEDELKQPAEGDDDDLAEGDEGAAPPDEEEDSDETSLDELLSQRAAARRSGDDSDEDEDIMTALPASERESPSGEPLPTRVIPVKDRQEFVCSNCHLVKARSQLADAERMLCRDCA